MIATRIRRYKVTQTGKRGIITIPAEQLKNLEIEEGGELTLYSGAESGRTVLILANADEPRLAIGGSA